MARILFDFIGSYRAGGLAIEPDFLSFWTVFDGFDRFPTLFTEIFRTGLDPYL